MAAEPSSERTAAAAKHRLPTPPRRASRWVLWIPWLLLVLILVIQTGLAALVVQQAQSMRQQHAPLAALEDKVSKVEQRLLQDQEAMPQQHRDVTDGIKQLKKEFSGYREEMAVLLDAENGAIAKLKTLRTEVNTLMTKIENFGTTDPKLNSEVLNKLKAVESDLKILAANAKPTTNPPSPRKETPSATENDLRKQIADDNKATLEKLAIVEKASTEIMTKSVLAELDTKIKVLSDTVLGLRKAMQRDSSPHLVMIVLFHTGTPSPLIALADVKEFISKAPPGASNKHFRIGVGVKQGKAPLVEVLNFPDFDSGQLDNLNKYQAGQVEEKALDYFESSAPELRECFTKSGVEGPARKVAVLLVSETADPPRQSIAWDGVQVHVLMVLSPKMTLDSLSDKDPKKVPGWVEFCRLRQGTFQILPSKNSTDMKLPELDPVEVRRELLRVVQPSEEEERR